MDIKFDQREFDIIFVEDDEGKMILAETDGDSEDLMQRLYLRLKTFPRDLFWNTGYGIDYLNDVFGKNKPKYTVDIILRNEILKEPMVDKILFFESEIVDFRYACKFTVLLKKEKIQETFYILTTGSGIILTDRNGDTLNVSY